MTSHDKSINFEENFECDEAINNSHVECVIDTGEICSFLYVLECNENHSKCHKINMYTWENACATQQLYAHTLI